MNRFPGPVGLFALVLFTLVLAAPDVRAQQTVVGFRATDAGAHYHVPVVVSPYGYSTHRGS